jgi:uncharacterized protein YggE
MKRILTAFFVLVTNLALGQVISPDNRIIVLGNASIEMPADQVTFSVSLVSTDTLSLDKVYEEHRKLETSIYGLLKELNVPAKRISYSMFSVGKQYDYDTKREYFMGQQHVTFTLDSIELVPDVQAKLIRGGFSQFGSSFTSTNMESRKKELLEKAVAVAKEKATVLANASDRKIKRIIKVADTDDADYTFSNYSGVGYASEISAPASITEIPQTVSISTTIKVTFELK